jgi:hypothetical protein
MIAEIHTLRFGVRRGNDKVSASVRGRSNSLEKERRTLKTRE